MTADNTLAWVDAPLPWGADKSEKSKFNKYLIICMHFPEQILIHIFQFQVSASIPREYCQKINNKEDTCKALVKNQGLHYQLPEQW